MPISSPPIQADRRLPLRGGKPLLVPALHREPAAADKLEQGAPPCGPVRADQAGGFGNRRLHFLEGPEADTLRRTGDQRVEQLAGVALLPVEGRRTAGGVEGFPTVRVKAELRDDQPIARLDGRRHPIVDAVAQCQAAIHALGQQVGVVPDLGRIAGQRQRQFTANIGGRRPGQRGAKVVEFRGGTQSIPHVPRMRNSRARSR